MVNHELRTVSRRADVVGAVVTFGKSRSNTSCNSQHVDLMKTAAVYSRIEPEIKEEESNLQCLGLSVSLPNEQMVKALEDSRAGRNLE